MSLQDLVKSNPKDAKLAANFEQSMQAIDGAMQVLPEQQRQSPEFVLQVIDGLLDAAGAEYGAAIADNKISAVIEYPQILHQSGETLKAPIMGVRKEHQNPNRSQ
jgi:hypothetical protein